MSAQTHACSRTSRGALLHSVALTGINVVVVTESMHLKCNGRGTHACSRTSRGALLHSVAL